MTRNISQQELKQRFPILRQSGIYLNHAAMSPWARDTAHAVCHFADENQHYGARNYAQWMVLERRVHEQLAQLIHAPDADDIALVKNTTEGLCMVAEGIDWRPGDEVIIADCEFPSNRLPWLALKKHGVIVHQVSLDNGNPETSLLQAVNPRTRLLSVSAVQYANGLRMDLQHLSIACKKHGILFCVDAIQQLGALDLNVLETPCDFLTADAHKWLMGPEGIAVFYSRPETRKQLQLREQGWRMYDDPFNFGRVDWRPPAGSRRFEAGSPNMMGIFALHAALGIILEYGMDCIEQRLMSNMTILFEALAAQSRLDLLSDERDSRRSGIISFKPRNSAQTTLIYRELLQQGIYCAKRGEGLRWSPHFYQSTHDMAQAVDILNKIVNGHAEAA